MFARGGLFRHFIACLIYVDTIGGLRAPREGPFAASGLL
jgi:hypothetical protein